MAQLLAKIAISLITKLITEKFLARLVIEGLTAWSKTTSNDLDDKVVKAMAEALEVDVSKVVK